MTIDNELFTKAAEVVKSLAEKPDNDTLLQLYALYKQATLGNVSGKKPGMTQIAKRMKWEEWSKLKGTPEDEAKQRYIEFVASLKR